MQSSNANANLPGYYSSDFSQSSHAESPSPASNSGAEHSESPDPLTLMTPDQRDSQEHWTGSVDQNELSGSDIDSTCSKPQYRKASPIFEHAWREAMDEVYCKINSICRAMDADLETQRTTIIDLQERLEAEARRADKAEARVSIKDAAETAVGALQCLLEAYGTLADAPSPAGSEGASSLPNSFSLVSRLLGLFGFTSVNPNKLSHRIKDIPDNSREFSMLDNQLSKVKYHFQKHRKRSPSSTNAKLDSMGCVLPNIARSLRRRSNARNGQL
ncbi:hypothetical protein VNI00_002506 [Paramarasmius palmivorus]|uniref:Uncharacterized protein n=1 Tax=Paramarasmius palmivorus TaxID=297713 RepID=A0AAW0DUP6_9AGAR